MCRFLKGGTKYVNRYGYWSFINVRLFNFFMLHELIHIFSLNPRTLFKLADFSFSYRQIACL